MKIFLIGLPGSGKTTLGKWLAEKLDKPFIDLDERIEHREAQSVSAIFERKGEAYFRNVEQQVLLEVCSLPSDFICATGGGTPCYFSNMSRITNTGIAIFLDTSIGEILNRLSKQEVNPRPLLADTTKSLKEQVEMLRRERASFYHQAQYTFYETDKKEELLLSLVELKKETRG